MKNETKQITKLNKKEKMKIALDILVAILEIIVAFDTQNYVWLLVSMMWFLIAIIEICNIKIIKLKDNLIKTQDEFIKTIIKELKTILDELKENK